jgi:hypothetical protein
MDIRPLLDKPFDDRQVPFPAAHIRIFAEHMLELQSLPSRPLVPPQATRRLSFRELQDSGENLNHGLA